MRQVRAAPCTRAVFDLSHADTLADQCEVSILNVVVMIEYSTLEGAPTQRMLTPECRYRGKRTRNASNY